MILMKEIGRGAEAVLYQEDGKLIKDRISKGYRIKELDESIRSERTKREAGIMIQANRIGVNVPRILSQEKYRIEMEFIDGRRLKELLNSDISKEELTDMGRKIGEQVGKLHKNSLVHGDLTTSNMILKEDKIYLIDFGLSNSSNRLEDHGTDLAVLKEAFKSTHFRRMELLWQSFREGYLSKNDQGDKVLNVLKNIEKRGRYVRRNE